MAGEKTVEYREVKPTTYKNYLKCDSEGFPLFYTSVEFPEEEGLDLYIYNNGVCPFVLRDDIKYLRLNAGATAKDMDSAVVEVKYVSASPGKRFDVVGKEIQENPEGRFCIWVIELHLGNIISLHRKQ